jgi:pimeloyl-ACP methyl ester carboxylesterase
MELLQAGGRVIAVEVVGERKATPILLCHGLADSRLAALSLAREAAELGLCVIAPDRPGMGASDRRPLSQVADWAEDAVLVLDALGIDSAALLGISGGGPYAAACAARLPARVRSLTLVSPLGQPSWPASGMAPSERFGLALAALAPGFGGWAMGRLADLARSWPELFLRLAATAQPEADVRALSEPAMRDSFLSCYIEAFRHGSWGVEQDLRVLTRPWGFDLGTITVPTWVRHGDADTTVPLQHARRYAEAIPGARLQIHPGDGHFSILSHARDILAPVVG